jgi:hypothetical protein
VMRVGGTRIDRERFNFAAHDVRLKNPNDTLRKNNQLSAILARLTF